MKFVARLRLRGSPERGAVLIYVAVALIGLLAVSALAIDMGVMMVGRRQTQNAADAGALAGAISLAYVQRPSDPDNLSDPAYARAKQAAVAVAQSNRAWGQAPRVIEATDVQIIDCPEPIPGLPDKCLRVNAYRNQEGGAGNAPLPTFFARLVGVNEQGARATATAQLIPGTSVSCIKPWAVPDLWYDVHDEFAPVPSPPDVLVTPEDAYELYEWLNQNTQDPRRPLANPDVYVPRGQEALVNGQLLGPSGYTAEGNFGRFIALKAGDPHGAIQPGWFYPITLGVCTGGDCYRDCISGCCGTEVDIGTQPAWPVEPGNMIGPTRQGIAALLAKDPNAQLTCSGGSCAVQNSVCPGSPVCEQGRSPRWVPLPVFNPYTYLTERNNGRFVFHVEEFIGVWIDGLYGTLPGATKTALQSQFPGQTFDNNDVIGRFVPLPASGGDRDGTSTFLRTVVLVR